LSLRVESKRLVVLRIIPWGIPLRSKVAHKGRGRGLRFPAFEFQAKRPRIPYCKRARGIECHDAIPCAGDVSCGWAARLASQVRAGPRVPDVEAPVGCHAHDRATVNGECNPNKRVVKLDYGNLSARGRVPNIRG